MRPDPRRTCTALCLLFLLCPLTVSRAGVIVVDVAGGADFSQVQPALDAAPDGDIVLVRPGLYGGPFEFLSVSGKALTLVGDVGGDVRLPPMLVDTVPAGGTFVLRNMTFEARGLAQLLNGTLVVLDAHGVVHIEDCGAAGLDGAGTFGGQIASAGLPALVVRDSAAVSITRSSFQGGSGVDTMPVAPGAQQVTSSAGPAVQVSSSQVSLYDVAAAGGDGGSDAAWGVIGGDGGEALSAAFSELLVSGGSFQGGSGGGGAPAGASGAGIRATGPGTALRYLGVSASGGPGAVGIDAPDGPLVSWSAAPCVLDVSAPVRSGEAGQLRMAGPANTVLGVFLSFGMDRLVLPGFHGSWLLEQPFAGPLVLASTDASGELVIPFLAPDLTPFGLDGVLAVYQALSDQGADGLVLSSATSSVQVAPGS